MDDDNQNKHFCKCGCGKTITVTDKHRSRGIPKFIQGHASYFVAIRGRQIPTKEQIDKLYKSGLSFKEIGDQLGWSQSFINNKAKEYGIEARHNLTKEQRQRIGDRYRGKVHSQEFRDAVSKRMAGRVQSQEEKDKRANSNRGKKRTPEQRKRLSEGVRKAMQNPDLRERLSKAAKRAWSKPEIAAKQIAAVFAAVALRPNKSEIQLKEIIEEVCPGEYQFVGDGSLIIDRLNPDFIHIKGKKIIELFGELFHRPGVIKKEIPFRRTSAGRKRAFGKFGYKTLVIWWKELKDIEKLKKKIEKFNSIKT